MSCCFNTALSSTKLFADDTTLPVLDPGRGKTKEFSGTIGSLSSLPNAGRRGNIEKSHKARRPPC